MGWSLPLGRIFGIPIKVHVTFFLLLVLVFFLFQNQAGTNLGGFSAVVTICALFACVLAHELGHSMMALYFGIKTRGIVLLPIGGVALLEEIPREPKKEILIALAGPLVSIILTGTFLGLAFIFDVELKYDPADLSSATFLGTLAMINATLVIFNFIPAFPMDGGRVYRGIMSLVFGWEKGTMIAVRTGQVIAIIFFFAGILLPGFWMIMLVGLFVFFGAGQEGRIAQVRVSVKGCVVAQAMIRSFESLMPSDTILVALNKMVKYNQDDIPVLDGDEFIGMATQSAILEGVKSLGVSADIKDIPLTKFPTTSPFADMEDFSMKIMRFAGKTIPVLDNGVLVGLITWNQVNRFARLHRFIKNG